MIFFLLLSVASIYKSKQEHNTGEFLSIFSKDFFEYFLMYLLQLHCHNVLKMIKKRTHPEDAPKTQNYRSYANKMIKNRTHPKYKIIGCMPTKSIFLYELVLNAKCIRQKFFTSLSNYVTFNIIYL